MFIAVVVFCATYRKSSGWGHGILRALRGPVTKIPRYDIFSGPFGEDARWLEAVEGAGKALDRMKLLAGEVPGPYFVFCQQTHCVMASMNTTRFAKNKNIKTA